MFHHVWNDHDLLMPRTQRDSSPVHHMTDLSDTLTNLQLDWWGCHRSGSEQEPGNIISKTCYMFHHTRLKVCYKRLHFLLCIICVLSFILGFYFWSEWIKPWKILSQDSSSPCWGLNTGPPKYKVEVLSTQQYSALFHTLELR